MKPTYFLPVLLLGVLFTSCTTYQYTARHTSIYPKAIDTKDQRASIDVNYSRKVTATSNYQLTRKDAIAEAEFLCIQNENIDVVVDPIFKIEYHPAKMKKQYRATIIGFAGTYKSEPNAFDESKTFTIEDIEKFKLLYDPSFMPYYYQQFLPAGGDVYNYYIKSGVNGTAGSALKAAPLAMPKASAKTPGSVMLKNQPKRPLQPMDPAMMYKAKKLRDAGICMTSIGAAVCLGAGLPVFLLGVDDRFPSVSASDAAIVSGIVVMGVGAATCYSGIIMASVGGARYNKAKKAQHMNLTFNAGANGIGLGLTF